MSVYRQPDYAWMVEFLHQAENDESQWITKEGFATRREARQWEQNFRPEKNGGNDMLFRNLVQAYCNDRVRRIRKRTFEAKKELIETKLLPYLGEKRICDMTSADILAWQGELAGQITRDDFRTVCKQLVDILDYGVHFSWLPKNPARFISNTQPRQESKIEPRCDEEYQKLAGIIADERIAHCCREVLSWSGIRAEELLALTAGDINLKRRTITISKAFQTIDDGVLAAEPKPLKTRRKAIIPSFLCDELREYIRTRPKMKRKDKLFPITELLSTAQNATEIPAT